MTYIAEFGGDCKLSPRALLPDHLSQLEQGKRVEPGPRYLTYLARVYDVEVQLLFEKAGYTDAPEPSEIDRAFQMVLSDPKFKFGTRLPGDLNESSKRVIIELYEKATKKRLLRTSEDADHEQGSSKRTERR